MSNTGGSRPGFFVPPTVEELNPTVADYEVLELMAQGGMGAVYKARQLSSDKLVALKVLPHLDDDGGMRVEERFDREAQAMAGLRHPNICEVYEIGQTSEGLHFFSMEHIDGGDLHTHFKGGKLTVDHVFSWIAQICEALDYAHAQGIVHRDIKPANVLVTSEGEIKLIDFGLVKPNDPAKLLQRLTLTNMAIGTPDFVAPEARIPGVDADHRADLYAVGVMIYQMLTGKLPRGAWRPPSAMTPGIDPRFDPIVIKAMAPEPQDRYQSAREISEDIRTIRKTPRFVRADDGAGPKSRKIKRVRKQVAKGSSLATWLICGGVLVLVALLLAGISVFGGR